MRNKLFIESFILLGLAFMTSCSETITSGPAKDVLSKRDYSRVVNAYEVVGDFVDGYAIVQQDLFKVGLINTKGEELIPCTYYYLSEVCDGAIVAERRDEASGDYSYALIDVNGKEIEPFQKYDEIDRSFSDGFVVVKAGKYSDRKYTYVNTKGEELFPLGTYNECCRFSEGYGRVEKMTGKHSKYGFINTNGEEVIPCKFAMAKDFSDGMAIVRNNNWKYGFIDKTGNVVVEQVYTDVDDFSEGLAYAENINNQIIVINNKGEVQFTLPSNIIPGGSFHNGLSLVKDRKKGLYGYINSNGIMSIPCIYKRGDDFEDGVAGVRTVDGVYTYIDTKGKEVVKEED